MKLYSIYNGLCCTIIGDNYEKYITVDFMSQQMLK